jgi:hypothetical protein
MILSMAMGAFISFPFGVCVGYLWRDRISRTRRERFLAERKRRRRTPNEARALDPDQG